MRISDWSSDVCSSDLYARQDVAAFKPRVDRDAVVLPGSGPSAEAFPFLRIQFFQQGLENYEYETYNGTAALEWQPNDDLKFYFDATLTPQTRSEKRRVGKECVRTGRSSCRPFHEKKNYTRI